MNAVRLLLISSVVSLLAGGLAHASPNAEETARIYVPKSFPAMEESGRVALKNGCLRSAVKLTYVSQFETAVSVCTLIPPCIQLVTIYNTHELQRKVSVPIYEPVGINGSRTTERYIFNSANSDIDICRADEAVNELRKLF